MTTKSVQYNHGKNKLTTVQFDIVIVNGKKLASNIIITSNFRLYYPKNPQIRLDPKAGYGFFENGVFSTNGDIQQIIKRIHKIVEETKD
ncbi:hypothetical protein EGI22_06080 [Lacihabitans sp. LS3-19]|uniref:hypothetical protein n=1 Tax=Lacihabitans sp. LS3-19 TaxID=2487335 RepID=UPI0020CCA6BB|nr:hypothetical protein [Lacihabitans sp. LS3-19]MCP9767472.1 hypothetical protein [Lacihabitans sp. LS3-19]